MEHIRRRQVALIIYLVHKQAICTYIHKKAIVAQDFVTKLVCTEKGVMKCVILTVCRTKEKSWNVDY